MISLSASAATPLKFALGRIYRLLPTVLICAPITFLVALAVHDGSLQNLLLRLVRSLLFIPVGEQIDGVYWTLGIEIAFYSLVFAVLFFGLWRNFALVLYAITCLSLAFILLNLIKGYGAWMGGRIAELALLKHGCLFAAGGLIYIAGTGKASPLTYVFAFLALLGGFLEIINSYVAYGVSGQIMGCAVFASAIIILFTAIKFNTQIISALHGHLNWLRQVGVATYPLYLIHQLVGAALIGYLFRWGLDKYASVIISSIAIFCLVWGVVKLEPALRRLIKQVVERRLSAVSLRLQSR